MSEQFPKAPDNQPTSNIETMLQTAKASYYEWETAHRIAQESLERAERMMNYWDDQEQRFEYQLRERRLQEVNGL